MKSPGMVAIYRPTYMAGLKFFCNLDIKGLFRFFFGVEVQEMDAQVFLRTLSEGSSFLRWGDGETAIFRGKDIWHQNASGEITLKAQGLLKQVCARPDVIFSFPIASLRNLLFDRSSWFWTNRKQLWATRVLFNSPQYRNFSDKMTPDAGIFYSQPQLIVDILQVLDARNRDVVFISHEESEELLSEIPGLEFIRIRKRNSFQDYDLIKDKLSRWLRENPNRPLVLFAGGPTMKILTLDMFQTFQFIDVGIGAKFLNSQKRFMDWEN